MDRFKGVVSTKDLECGQILGDNFDDEVGDNSKDLGVVVEEEDLAHRNKVLNKYIVKTVAQDRSVRGAQDIAMTEIKRG